MTSRVGSDRCPGALSLHEAADGLLARVRLPGGFIPPSTLRGVADLAAKFGDERLELTSRGNLQIRAIRGECQADLAEEIAALGLLPSTSHERVRNVVASPLAGLDGSDHDLCEVVAQLDILICSTPQLAELSGRFLFGIDDGRGDIDMLGPDVIAVAQGEHWLISPGGFSVAISDVPAALVVVAEVFLAVRSEHNAGAGTATLWRMRDLGDDVSEVARRALAIANARGWASRWATSAAPQVVARLSAAPAPVGLVPSDGEGPASLVVQVPLGRLSTAQAHAIADVMTTEAARITPWRSIVIPRCGDGAQVRSTLEATGLVIDATAVWNNLTACAGQPGCAKSLADVQSDATRAAQHGSRLPLSVQTGPRQGQGQEQEQAQNEQATPLGALDGETVGEGAAKIMPQLPVHWSGCERRCGKPTTPFVDVLATEDGYRVTNPMVATI